MVRVRPGHDDAVEPDDFATSLRAAIKARGLSLERLRFHLARQGHDLSIATLSYWQSGRSRPERASSLSALAVLEGLLDVEPRALSRLLERPELERPGSVGGVLVPDESDYLEALHSELGVRRDHGFVRLSLHESVEIGDDHTLRSRTTREVLQATHDGFDRFVTCTHQSGDGSEPDLTALTNATITAQARRPGQRVVAARLQLPRPLRAGEAIIVEYRVDVDAGGDPEEWWERLCSRRIRQLHVEVRFRGDDLPLSAHTYSKVGERETSEPIAVTDGRLAVLTEDFGPGLFGVRWRW